MKLSSKQAIDRFLGLPVLVVVNLMARLLGFLLRRNHAIDPVKYILIMKFQGIGSLVIAKPSLQALRKAYPEARILFWGTTATAELAHLMLEFDEVLVLKDSGIIVGLASLLQNLVYVWKLGIDWAFDLEVYSKVSSILATLTCARNRVGFAIESVRNRRNALTHLVFFNRYEYLGRAYGRLLSVVSNRTPQESGLTVLDWGAWKMPLTRTDKIPVGPYIVVNIHAGELSLERRWPPPYFEALIASLTEAGHTVVLIGHGKFEVSETAKVAALVPKSINLSGKLTLQETIACLANSALVISGDTAPMHLAIATTAPVLALFGPTKASTYFPPQRPNSATLSHVLYCSPCVHHWYPPPCLGDNQCMKQITIDEVLVACGRLLGKTLTTRAQTPSLLRPDYFDGLVYERS